MLVVGRVEFCMGLRVVEIFMGIFLMGEGLRSNVNVGEAGIRDQGSKNGWL